MIDRNRIDKIVIRGPNPVGDLIMATPALRAIREGFPEARISLLVKVHLRGLIEGSPWFDEVIGYDPQGIHSSWKGYLRLVKELRRQRFDLGLLLTNSFSSAWMLWLAGAKRRMGYNRDGRRLLLTHALDPSVEWAFQTTPRNKGYLPLPMVDYYLRLCEALDCRSQDPRVELSLDEKSMESAQSKLGAGGWDGKRSLLGINPAAGFGTSKLWTEEGFARVADALAERHALQPLLLTGPGEEGLARKIAERMRRRPIDIGGAEVSLELLKALVSRCALFLTTDSGPRHIAVAFDLPTVVLMGPTDPRYSDLGHEKTLVLREEAPCSPCHLKACPTDHRCMRGIEPGRVLAAAEELLARYSKPTSKKV